MRRVSGYSLIDKRPGIRSSFSKNDNGVTGFETADEGDTAPVGSAILSRGRIKSYRQLRSVNDDER